MPLSIFNIIEAILTAIILIYLLYYVYSLLSDRQYQPRAWKEAVKKGRISRDLIGAAKKYPDKERFFNFWFQIERLKADNIQGAFAELGVYKGDSAAIMHLMDPDRIFHLYDTFEGFQSRDLKVESGKAATYTPHNFADTHIDRVKQKLISDKFIFHQGYFPDTTKDSEDAIFALVSLDADLLNPTQAALQFFYPRLAPGGLIIIHDYNPDWPGIMQAVDAFARSIPEPIIPLTDRDNSVMICKSKK